MFPLRYKHMYKVRAALGGGGALSTPLRCRPIKRKGVARVREDVRAPLGAACSDVAFVPQLSSQERRRAAPNASKALEWNWRYWGGGSPPLF